MENNKLIKAMTDVELYPTQVDDKRETENYIKFPLSQIASFGVAFEPVVGAIQQVISGGQATSGIYRVTVPAGMHLAELKSGAGFIGSSLSTTNQVAGQAVLNPLMCDPTMICMAMVLANINKKLDAIQEGQEDILEYLKEHDRAELRANITFLSDTLKNYRYNWNNDMYLNNYHVKVLDIRNSADREIEQRSAEIKRKLEKKSFLASEKDIQKKMQEVLSDMKEYHLAIYSYAFSSFLEVVLQKNFAEDYLQEIVERIKTRVWNYRELRTNAYVEIEKASGKSVNSLLIKGASKINTIAGKAIEKVPVISKSQLDENLIAMGDKIGQWDEERIRQSMLQFSGREIDNVKPFIDNIEMIKYVNNNDNDMLFDKEYIYLKEA